MVVHYDTSVLCVAVTNEACYLIDTRSSATRELKFSAIVRQIASASSNYVVVLGQKTLALVDGCSGEQLCSISLDEKVSSIFLSP